ncbi:hypothetical protein JCM8547_004171 [Rhodosporidiobolus lusitaniae]
MHSHSLLAAFVASASLVAATSSPINTGHHGSLDRRDPLLGASTPSAHRKTSFSAAHKSSSADKGKVQAKWGRTAAIKRTTVPLGVAGVANDVTPLLDVLIPVAENAVKSSSLPVGGSDSAAPPTDGVPVLAAVPSTSGTTRSVGAGNTLVGLPLPLVKRANALDSLLSGNAVAAAVAPLVNAPNAVAAPVAALNGNQNSPVANLAAPLLNINQPAVNILSPGAKTMQVTAQNYAPNGTIVQGNNNRVTGINGNHNNVIQGDKNSDVLQGDKNRAILGDDNDDSSLGNGISRVGGSGSSSFSGSARGRSGGQRNVNKVGKHSPSSSSSSSSSSRNTSHSSNSGSSGSSHSGPSRAIKNRKALSRAKVAKASSQRIPSHTSSNDFSDSGSEGDCVLPASVAPTATTTRTRTRTLYKTVTRIVQGPTPTPERKNHLLDLDIAATVNKVAKAVADVEVL